MILILLLIMIAFRISHVLASWGGNRLARLPLRERFSRPHRAGIVHGNEPTPTARSRTTNTWPRTLPLPEREGVGVRGSAVKDLDVEKCRHVRRSRSRQTAGIHAQRPHSGECGYENP